MYINNRLPSFALEGNYVWHFFESKTTYIKGRILKIDRLKETIRIKVDLVYLPVTGSLEIDVPILKTEEVSSEEICSHDISDLRLVNLPEILHFFETIVKSDRPFFRMKRTLVYLSTKDQKYANEFEKEKYLEIMNNTFFETGKKDCDLNIFLAGILGSLKREKGQKSLFIFGKNLEVKNGQKKEVLWFLEKMFSGPTIEFHKEVKYAMRLMSYLSQTLDFSGKKKQIGFYKFSFEFDEKMLAKGIKTEILNIYSSFLCPENPSNEYPLLLYLAKFYFDEQKNEILSEVIFFLKTLFTHFSLKETEILSLKYAKLKKSMKVNLKDI